MTTTKQHLLDYTTYNNWANRQIIHVLHPLSEETLRKTLPGSFPSIHDTVCHLWNAQSIWLQRLQMQEHIRIESPDNSLTAVKDALQGLEQTSTSFIDFVKAQMDDRAFVHEIRYNDIKGNQQKNTVYDCIHHCMNHSTYHRAQLVNYLRALDIHKVPATDYIAWVRSKK